MEAPYLVLHLSNSTWNTSISGVKCSWTSLYSMILMLKSGTIANTNSYQDLMAAAFGRVGFAILSVIQFFFPFVGKGYFL